MDGCETLPRPATLLSAGVDWLTATAHRLPANEPFRVLGDKLIAEQHGIGHEVKTWKAGGYHGLQSEGIIRGVRHDTHIIKLSSDMAHDHWREVAALASNVSRLDVEITFKFDEPVPDFISNNQRLALSHGNGRGRRRAVTLIQSSTDGDSLYLGKRSSEVYARAYDKGRELKIAEAGLIFRQELEYKSDRALSVARQLDAAPCAITEATALVCSYMRSSGVQTMWNGGKRAMAARENLRVKPRQLRWLESSCRPSVIRLCDAGRVEDVIDALGLRPYVQALPKSNPNTNTEE